MNNIHRTICLTLGLFLVASAAQSQAAAPNTATSRGRLGIPELDDVCPVGPGNWLRAPQKERPPKPRSATRSAFRMKYDDGLVAYKKSTGDEAAARGTLVGNPGKANSFWGGGVAYPEASMKRIPLRAGSLNDHIGNYNFRVRRSGNNLNQSRRTPQGLHKGFNGRPSPHKRNPRISRRP